MVSKHEILSLMERYDKDALAITTVCSHSSLQIFDGARNEGFLPIGSCIG
ncbi:MAG: DUF1246 domain-containing protein, partial [Candidatus Methanoperedens sp.]|nr:DUF1246 domain-containing protein [Candidatus Methanoperedens sp.]